MPLAGDKSMFIVVAYDIEDDKQRTRLHKTLRRFGEPVQFSVFECILTNDQFADASGGCASARRRKSRSALLRDVRRV